MDYMFGGRNSKMVVPPLYTISLQKVFSLLENGMWNSCIENPFSFCPMKVIEDLMTLAYPDARNMTGMGLLLTSGRIHYLHLRKINFRLQKDLDVLLKMLSQEICKNIRKLSIPKELTSNTMPLLETVLRMCINLEDVHSEILFDLNALAGCTEMRCLRFHAEKEESFEYISNIDFDVLRSLNNLEIFTFCNGCVPYIVDPAANAKVLLNCPKIISVGYVDTTLPLESILQTESHPTPHFKLRRCLWGHLEWGIRNLRFLNQYKEKYSEYIKNAVSFFPFVEELVLLVFDSDCLQYLGGLQHLTFLCLTFHYHKSEYYIPDLVSLLQKIGPQMRHLAVEAAAQISFGIVSDLCPNLESLLLVNPSVTENAEPSLGLQRLKRLALGKVNREALMYLLSNCRDLTELHLNEGGCLEDGLLISILKKNPLPKLKIVSIFKCGLSKDGLRMLLQRVPSLESVYISDKLRDVVELADELNLGTKQRPLYINVHDYFYRKKYTCIF